MVLPILLCGAVPFEPSVTNSAMISGPCEHCQIIESFLMDAENHREPSEPSPNLPDVVTDSFINVKNVRMDDELDHRRMIGAPSSPVAIIKDDEEIVRQRWKQVGRDLRRIADDFHHHRTPRSSSSSNSNGWMWSYLINTLVVVAGWKIHRWMSLTSS